MSTSVNWELPDGRHFVASGTVDEVRLLMTHLLDLERRLMVLECQVAHVEQMTSAVLGIEKLESRRTRRKERTDAYDTLRPVVPLVSDGNGNGATRHEPDDRGLGSYRLGDGNPV
jgi:hypothetical protein